MSQNHYIKPPPGKKNVTAKLVLSYVLDWLVLAIGAVLAGACSKIEPNKRPFALNDPNISLQDEAVPMWLLVVLILLVPAGLIAVVTIVFVPGATVPRDTPASLVWRRKLWELHAGWLGLAMSLVTATLLVQGLKNMFGKPRPDLLDRCKPDLDNAARFVVGGVDVGDASNRLYSSGVCQQTDSSVLDDGFRSYPSGHSAGAASGLIYLALFLASKFSVTLPFVVPTGASADAAAHEAFPSRSSLPTGGAAAAGPDADFIEASHNAQLRALRRQAASPPLYLFALVFIPICASLWIAASRWYDFRHHGFDIICGYLIGLVPAYFSFRYYHLPIHQGAGWAWGPRSSDRAFWAGVGHLGYVGEDADHPSPSSALGNAHKRPFTGDAVENGPGAAADHRPAAYVSDHQHQSSMSYSNGYAGRNDDYGNEAGGFHDIEMGRMRNNRI
ncbi:PAP2 superfamily [Geosmithia morbida]|uniref:PAP2 superfamily n=1 Tax=Geosmithia morbida TaxID=1094350 RepID=A0A9P4YVT6_9HYPO|nr:PAP2 superfamily [Geosmithia morbida]KAF4122608.1 PAP2 superfamily [Geosmithia morbida]